MLDLRLMILIQPETLRDPLSFARAALNGGATVLQLRGKSSSTRTLYDVARDLGALCRAYQASLIINDRLDIALALGGIGAHLGPDDLPLSQAGYIGEQHPFVLGASARTVHSAQRMEQAGVDYLGVGAVHATATKPEAPVIGVDGVTRILRAVNVPVVAIGGIKPGDCADLKSRGAAGVAVQGGVVAPMMDTEAAVRAYRKAWESS